MAKSKIDLIPEMQKRPGFSVAPIDISMFEKELNNVEPLDSIWASTPPSPHEIMHNKHFLGRPNLYPDIQRDMEILFSGPNYSPICDVFLDDEGLGSGKSTKMAVCVCIMIVRLFHLKNIEEYFNFEKGISKLAIYNLAPTATTASQIVFNRFQNMLINMPWFVENGIEIDKNITSSIVFKNKPLVIQPGNSSKAFGVGYDTFMCLIDECAAGGGFETKNKDNFLDLFESANERRRSRFIDTPEKGLMFCASSAGTENRYFEKLITEIEELYEANPTLDPETDPIDHETGTVLYRRRSAFEANPKHKVYLDKGEFFEHTAVREPRPNKKITYKLRIPNVFKRRFDLNPAKLLRNMCAIPSLTISEFFTEWDKVLACVNRCTRSDPYPNVVDKYGYLVEVSPSEVWRALPDDFHGINNMLYYGHIDLALSGDGCGFGMGHRLPNIMYGKAELPAVSIDLSICFQGSLKRKIVLSEVKKFIIDLQEKRGFKFAKLTFDGFQSVNIMQDLEILGFIVEKSPVSKASFELLMELLYDEVPRLDWFVDMWALGEAKRLEDKGLIVEKSLGSTDDEIECVAKVCEEVVIGELPKDMQATRTVGFASKGQGVRGRMGLSSGSEMNRLNPQVNKQFIKPAYGIATGARRRR